MEFYMECTFTSPMSLIPDRPPDMDLKKNNSVPKSAARRTLSSLSRCLPKLCMQLLFSTVGKPAGAAAFAIASVIQSPRRSFPDLTHDTTKPAASQVYTSNHLSLSLSLSHTHTHTHRIRTPDGRRQYLWVLFRYWHGEQETNRYQNGRRIFLRGQSSQKEWRSRDQAGYTVFPRHIHGHTRPGLYLELEKGLSTWVRRQSEKGVAVLQQLLRFRSKI